MKNVILGIVSLFIVIYLMLISMNVYTVVVETNEMECKISRIVTNCLEDYYQKQEDGLAKTQIEEDVLLGEKAENVEIKIRVIDLEKGLLSVIVNKTIPLVTGESKIITLEKTAIMERVYINQPRVKVSFFCEGELYKQYELTTGETCPVPKLPDETYSCWMEVGNEAQGAVIDIGTVCENRNYYAKKN